MGLRSGRSPRRDGGPGVFRPCGRHGPCPGPRAWRTRAKVSPAAHILALPIRAYRLILSPWVGHGCRFQPTCSAYALEALDRHGALKGGWLVAHRLCRCHPWGGSGFDPVPPATED
ncbi:MAG: membrane protein insertion efficiency factor YidD [Rhodobacter sp.]|nr:membrane protein insertion efficiency factor YidD [Rhodobacter sp.]